MQTLTEPFPRACRRNRKINRTLSKKRNFLQDVTPFSLRYVYRNRILHMFRRNFLPISLTWRRKRHVPAKHKILPHYETLQCRGQLYPESQLWETQRGFAYKIFIRDRHSNEATLLCYDQTCAAEIWPQVSAEDPCSNLARLALTSYWIFSVGLYFKWRPLHTSPTHFILWDTEF
jgi:hypothetical protein